MIQLKWFILIAITLHMYTHIADSVIAGDVASVKIASTLYKPSSVERINAPGSKVIKASSTAIPSTVTTASTATKVSRTNKTRRTTVSSLIGLRVVIIPMTTRGSGSAGVVDLAIYKLHRVAAKRFIRADIGLHEAKVYEKFREQLHEPTIQQQNERLDDNGLTNDILSSPIKPIFFSKYRYLILMPLYEENLSDFRERYLKQMKKIIDDMTLMFLLREMLIVLKFMHLTLGMTHGDIKLENMMIRKNPKSGAKCKWVVFIDFDQTRKYDPNTKREMRESQMYGTVRYSPEEILLGYPHMFKHDFASVILSIVYLRDDSDVLPTANFGYRQKLSEAVESLKGIPMSTHMFNFYRQKGDLKYTNVIVNMLLDLMVDYENLKFNDIPDYDDYIDEIDIQMEKWRLDEQWNEEKLAFYELNPWKPKKYIFL